MFDFGMANPSEDFEYDDPSLKEDARVPHNINLPVPDQPSPPFEFLPRYKDWVQGEIFWCFRAADEMKRALVRTTSRSRTLEIFRWLDG